MQRQLKHNVDRLMLLLNDLCIKVTLWKLVFWVGLCYYRIHQQA